MSDTTLIQCQFCGGDPVVGGDKESVWIECRKCRARGPVKPREPGADSNAASDWNNGRRFGRFSVANMPPGMTARAAGAAERLHSVSESIFRGELGMPDAVVVLLRERATVHTVTHNISNADVARVLAAVLDASKRRAVLRHG